ncbi:Uncharacterised protein [Legionella wadsworthii]|uniref:Uncharacterized protein n=1 Tax=Legionella wadsworthii TaxID=28088 RepID=A0A378LZL0_9GAMM|nr:hypothetical protein [Legionella wadsworthii]STY29501.1 Uncharacterised protein [Legionella wadsworthii]
MTTKDKLTKLIHSIRKDREITGNLDASNELKIPADFADVRNHVSRTILDYLTRIEQNLDQDDEETLSQKLGSLKVLSLTICGYGLLNGGLELMHKVNEFFTGNDRADYKLLAELGENVIKTAISFNALLDDSSKNLGEKVYLTMKAYAKAVISGIAGLFEGMHQGFKEGKGLIDTVSTMGQTSVAKGWAGFYERFSTELSKSSMTSMKESMNKERKSSATTETLDASLNDGRTFGSSV